MAGWVVLIGEVLVKTPEYIERLKQIANIVDQDRAVACVLENDTDVELVYVRHRFGGGHFITGQEPPRTIPPGHAGMWGAEDSGLMTGTDGTVIYGADGALPEDKNPLSGNQLRVVCNWDNPFIGSGNQNTAGAWRPWLIPTSNGPYEWPGRYFPITEFDVDVFKSGASKKMWEVRYRLRKM
ncbi:hypothetical protein [Puerhibacterium sp. TATVAM-FAB25]|uniref:hypothetical protein n=1 Tax=Puerhibacterium sp. TATVAM-FAB25 TaxID=3093699 RepID=UPI00397D85EF